MAFYGIIKSATFYTAACGRNARKHIQREGSFMPMDGLTLGAMARELNHMLEGGRVDRVQQTERDELILTLRAQGKNHKLLLSSSPNHARVHLTAATKKSPDTPPMFCMLLRKFLVNSRFMGVSQTGADRVLTFRFEGLDDFGDTAERRLIVEIMGRHSNLILVGPDGRILESARHVTQEISRVREVLPGLPYEAPPAQDKLNPYLAGEEDYVRALAPLTGQRLDKALGQSVSGLSAQAAREMAFRIAGSESAALSSDLLAAAAKKLRDFFARLEDVPTLLTDEDGAPLDVTSFPYLSRDPSRQATCPTLSAAMDAYYTQRDQKERIHQRAHSLRKFLQNALERDEKKLAIQRQTLLDAQNMDQVRKMGDLITSSIHLIPRGAKKAVVPDYFSEGMPEIEIPLNPALSPAANAQKFYKQYNKLKAASDLVLDQMAANEEEIAYLEGQLENLELCTTIDELAEIRQELVRQGLLRDVSKGRKAAKIPESKPHRFVSDTGIEIYVGKNNVQNDRLTGAALGEETWLHAKDMPGSHVIVKSLSPDAGTLVQAAQLAAYFSKGRQADKVPVDYTLRKYVKKPGGAKPGFVIYTHQQTLYVTPDEKLVKRLTPV